MATNRLFTEGEVTKLGGELNSSAHFLIFQLRHPRRRHKRISIKIRFIAASKKLLV